MADDSMSLLETLRKATAGDDVDVLREGVRILAERIMEAEVSELTGVARGERKPEAHTNLDWHRAAPSTRRCPSRLADAPWRHRRPSQWAAAILNTRVNGAIPAGERSTSRPGRSSARKYVSTKAKGRKANRNSRGKFATCPRASASAARVSAWSASSNPAIRSPPSSGLITLPRAQRRCGRRCGWTSPCSSNMDTG